VAMPADDVAVALEMVLQLEGISLQLRTVTN
jgi:hypothetical protein